jgi:oxygen-dependent protoporphyrinogen oxidase
VARAALDELLPASRLNGDTSVAGFVGARMGQAVVDRLVEPLLGGVYAGRADELSLRATLPQAAAVAGSWSLMRALRRRPGASAGTASDAPVFAGLPGGVGRLAEALTGWLLARGVDVELDSAVRGLERTAGGWRLTVGSAAAPRSLEADAVVLALPATPASRLVRGVLPAAAADLGSIEYSSMAIVTLAYPPSAFESPLRDRGLSGFLVPAIERRLIKAATFSSVKWGWYPDGVVIVRCSIGRHRDVEDLQRSDDELTAGARGDLAAMVGVRGVPIDSAVTRWGGALPQYAVGHLDRVARIKAAVAEVGGLAVCGAAYDGLGIPACVASGQAAATQILQDLFAEGQ